VIRAAMHLHSTYSDGEFTLAELREIFAKAGCRVVAVTDHADAFDPPKLHRYVAECASLSDEHVLMLPGLEFSCIERMHILGYGVTEPVDSQDPETVIEHIARHGGVSVIAHPQDTFFDRIAGFDRLPDGIEAWNTKYDGRQGPRPGTFEFIAEMRERKPELRAFYGIDLHWRRQFRDLHTLIESNGPAVTTATVLARLRSGRFSGAVGTLRLPSDADVPESLLREFAVANRRGRRLKAAFARAKRITDSIGLRPPDSLKAQLRRLF
jgi:hypothetical protein